MDDVGIGRLDLRLDASLDGLLAAGIGGWQAAEAAAHADFQDAGECFVPRRAGACERRTGSGRARAALTADDGVEADRGWSGAAAHAGAMG